MNKHYLVFNDQHPHGEIVTEEYLKTYNKFTTYIELETIEEVQQWEQALKEMRPIFELEEQLIKKPLL